MSNRPIPNSMSENHLRLLELPVNQLVPNNYNPNRLTDDEFAELVVEVRLGICLLKPGAGAEG